MSPAALVANAIEASFRDIPDINTTKWSAIDFGSGTGGPLPMVESLINSRRVNNSCREPIPFLLSDLDPNLDSWIPQVSKSANLSFIPGPVDAANPPFAAISVTTAGNMELARKQGFEHAGNKVFRLFCSTFHHFDDETAAAALRSSMETSDGFLIIELHERRVFNLIMVFFEACLLWIMALFWFRADWVHLAFTYTIPVQPIVHVIDGFISCLRARDFAETIRLVEKAYDYEKGTLPLKSNGQAAYLRGWKFTHSRVKHTWPFGFMTIISGSKNSEKSK